MGSTAKTTRNCRLCSKIIFLLLLRQKKSHSKDGIGAMQISKARVSAHYHVASCNSDTPFAGQELAFLVSDRTAFELPLERVSNSNIAGRTEVSLEFSNEAAKGSKNTEDEMVEIRFHVPGTQTKLKSGSDAGDADEPEEEEISAAQVFHDQIKEKADIGQVTGDMILSFEEVLVVTPRGRYDLDMFSEFLRLRGKTYDYKIVFSTISRLFLLPKDDQTVLFIVRPLSLILVFFSLAASARAKCPHSPRPDALSLPCLVLRHRRRNHR